MQFTILGCGVAGTWMAHHLAASGNHELFLYGGAPDGQTVREKGALSTSQPIQLTAADALKTHLLRVNPSTRVEVHGDFKMDDVPALKGTVIGAMNAKGACTGGGRALLELGRSWFTVGLPSRGTDAYFGSDPDRIMDDFFGPTCFTKQQVNEFTAEACKVLLSKTSQ